jgi:hypothetical protein
MFSHETFKSILGWGFCWKLRRGLANDPMSLAPAKTLEGQTNLTKKRRYTNRPG